MSVQTEIDRISTAVQNAHLKVIEKGGTSAAPYLVANLAEAIGTIPEATEPTLQSKSVTPSESAQTVKPDSGYDGLSSVAVGAISKTYVGSSVPKQAAQTITPGTADKTIASGRYLTGTQTIKGDANLVAENIKSGVSIFGVAGTVEEGGGASGSVETCSLTIICNDGSCLESLVATVYRDGKLMTVFPTANEGLNTYTLDDVVCGTSIYAVFGRLSIYGYSFSGGGERVFPDSGYASNGVCFAKMPSEAGANVTVTVYDND